jgi:hypothetical protein
MAAAAQAGTLRVDDELHLTPLAAEEEDPQVAKLRVLSAKRHHPCATPIITILCRNISYAA